MSESAAEVRLCPVESRRLLPNTSDPGPVPSGRCTSPAVKRVGSDGMSVCVCEEHAASLEEIDWTPLGDC
jgi:hypothetical protein